MTLRKIRNIYTVERKLVGLAERSRGDRKVKQRCASRGEIKEDVGFRRVVPGAETKPRPAWTREIFILMVDITRILVTVETLRVRNSARYHAPSGIYDIKGESSVWVFEIGTVRKRKILPEVPRLSASLPDE